MLLHLQQLTYLELASIGFDGFSPQQQLQKPALPSLPKLADLRLGRANLADWLIPRLLSGAQHLTRLDVTHCIFQPKAITGKTQLQHLCLEKCGLHYDDAVAPA